MRISGSTVAEPLITALHQEVMLAGGHPIVRAKPDLCEENFLRYGTDEQLEYANPVELFEVETIDCSIGIWADANTKALSGIDPSRQALASKSRRKISDTFLKRAARKELRWVGTEFPTHASAQDAEMSLSDFEDFVFSAGLLDHPDPAQAWNDVLHRQQRMCDLLEKGSELHFQTPHGTDLTLAIEGRRWINCAGKSNFPDGEVFSGPIEHSTQGVLYLTFPAVYGGREVNGVRLEFRDGHVVNASADKGQDFLIEMLDQDQGARTLGEVGIGTNYNVKRFMRNLTFDEKIGGTFHVAMGAAYPESGGVNESALHWDLVCDLRDGGSIALDGSLISANGRFCDHQWPQPA